MSKGIARLRPQLDMALDLPPPRLLKLLVSWATGLTSGRLGLLIGKWGGGPHCADPPRCPGPQAVLGAWRSLATRPLAEPVGGVSGVRVGKPRMSGEVRGAGNGGLPCWHGWRSWTRAPAPGLAQQ